MTETFTAATSAKEWSAQQGAIFQWFRNGKGNLVVRARAGCLAGDTMLNINRAGKGSPMTIEKVVGQFNGVPPLVYRSDLDCYQRMRQWDRAIETRIARADDDRVRLATMTSAYCSGVKATYTVTTDTGRSIRATDQHPFLLESGQWAELGSLTVGARVRVNVGQGGSDHAARLQYHQTDTRFHPHQVPNGRERYKVPTHRLVVEASMNGLPFNEYVEILRIDKYRSKNLHYLDESQIVHHKDGDELNNALGNLLPLSGVRDHAEHHDWGANVLARIGAETVVSIEPYGEELTYDLAVQDDPHCFLANGFVVHNTGKTTTILEAISHAPESRILLAAFNKKIADELTTRLRNPYAKAQTLHSVGFGYVMRWWEGIRIGEDNGRKRATALTDAICGEAVPPAIKRLVTKLHTKGREILPLVTDETIADLVDLAEEYDLEPDDMWVADGFTTGEVARYALDAMKLAAAEKPIGTGIDFADMIFLPIRNKWLRPRNDLIVIDETQDMNMAQLLIVRGASAGRIVVVGDDRQAIYSFRGAAADSLDNLKRELDATELGLTTTYRCGKAIVAIAQVLVPDFEAGPENPEGLVRSVPSIAAMVREVELGDFVLSRKNAPLAAVAMALIRAQKRVTIAGRQIGEGLTAVVNKVATGRATNSIPAFLEQLVAWRTREIERAERADKPHRVERIADQAETLMVLTEGVKGIADLRTRIDSLFSDNGLGAKGTITASSVHRAKGLEADRVYVLKDTLYPTRPCDDCGHYHAAYGAKQLRLDGENERCHRCGCDSSAVADTRIEEENIEYVAITRAKKELVWVLSSQPSFV